MLQPKKIALYSLLLLPYTLMAKAGFSKQRLDAAPYADSTRQVFHAIVDKKGTGNYTTLQQAIDRAPAGRTTPWLIFIKNGRYEELVRIPANKPFLHLIGQDRDSVVITFKINCANPENPKDAGKEFSKKKWNQSDCATVTAEAPDFYAENISFENAWGVEAQSGPQALALKTNNDRFAFYHCRFRSFQDTWMTSTKGINDRTYASDCWIEGAVDYFYGGGNAWVEHSTLYNVRSGSVIVAPSHREGTKWGYVFDHCTVDGNTAAADGRVKLGRPWHHQPVAVFLNTTMKINPHREGWTDMGPAAKLFAEYNSRKEDGQPVDLAQRRTWYQQSQGEGGRRIDGLKAELSATEAAAYTYEQVTGGEDHWNPRAYFVPVPQPAQLRLAAKKLTWKAAPKAIGYVVYRDKEVVGFTAVPSFQLPKRAKGKGVYTVQGINPYGSLGALSAGVVW
ncbi:pectinesterase family protein [Paraflavisolibacter sp. H34]|uniref:pectinesterase family protein n=1 Tax=Huijunlia imazamoxiresistens TaxID=3127457 RepID=UPI003017381B